MIVPLKEIFNIFQFSTQIYTMWIFSWKEDDWEGKSLWIYELPPAPEIKSHLFSIGRGQILTVKINIFLSQSSRGGLFSDEVNVI